MDAWKVNPALNTNSWCVLSDIYSVGLTFLSMVEMPTDKYKWTKIKVTVDGDIAKHSFPF